MSETPTAAPAATVKKFSFGRATPPPSAAPAPAAEAANPAPANAAAASAPAPEANAVPVHPAHAAAELPPRDLPATQPQHEPPAFYDGSEESSAEAGDVRFSRLNIVQKSSGAELLKQGFGSLVFKQSIKLPQPMRFVIAGIRPKIWIEKVKFGTQGRVARSVDEVVQLNGTEKWTFSKENPKANSTRAWFQPSVTALLLLQRPDSLPEDDFRFEAAGKLYAPALTSVKSTNYDAFFVAIQSEKVQGKLFAGYNTRFIDATTVIKTFSGGESAVFQLSFGEETPPEVRALAQNIIGR